MIQKLILGILLCWIFNGAFGRDPAAHAGLPENPAVDSITVQAVMDSVNSRFDRVRDYMVIVHVTVRMPGFRMPPKRVDLAFKQPDQVKVETTGFAVVPRTGMTMAPDEIFGDLAGPALIGRDTLNGRSHWLVSSPVHPDSLMFQSGRRRGPEIENTSVRLWIDGQRWIISRMEAYADTTNFVTVNAKYTEVRDDIWLPEETEFIFRFPENMTAQSDRIPPREMNPGMSDMENISPEQLAGSTGYVKLEFNHYRVNTGLTDRFFEREE